MDATGVQEPAQPGGWHRARATVLGAAATLMALGTAYASWGGMLNALHSLEHRSTVRTPDALPVLLWAALVLALLWAALLIALATGTLLRDARGGHGDSGTVPGPRHGLQPGGLVARLAGVLLALTALSGLSTAAPAFATSAAVSTTAAAHGTHIVVTTDDSCTEHDIPTPGWVPDKPARTDQVARDCAVLVTGRPVVDDSAEVVVHRGDTLWSIAAAQLGPHADAQAIAAEWPRWHAANRHTIGDDPDLLRIGTRLRMPEHALEGSHR